MSSEERRRKLVNGAIAFTEGTLAEVGDYERYLLGKYVQGILTIEEVLVLLEVAKRQIH